MEVLVVGGGGREHALAWKIKQSPKVHRIFCAPGNAGTALVGENIKISADDFEGLLNFAVQRDIDLSDFVRRFELPHSHRINTLPFDENVLGITPV